MPAAHRNLTLFLGAATIFVVGALMLLDLNSEFSRTVNPVTNNAYIDGDTTPISARVLGYIERLPIQDNQMVHAGDVVAEVEGDSYSATRDEAASQVEAAESALNALSSQEQVLEAQFAQSMAARDAARADFGRSSPELVRQRALIGTDAGVQRVLEQAEADQKRTEAMATGASALVVVRQRQLDLLKARVAQAMTAVEARRADLRFAEISLGWTRITTPVTGQAGIRRVKIGDLVKPGSEIVSVTPLEGVWVTANFTERQITDIRVGQKARLEIDTYPDMPLDGHVVGISPLTGSQQAAIPADNTTGNFTKVAQRVSVRIAFDWNDTRLKGMVRPGMSLTARVFTR